MKPKPTPMNTDKAGAVTPRTEQAIGDCLMMEVPPRAVVDAQEMAKLELESARYRSALVEAEGSLSAARDRAGQHRLSYYYNSGGASPEDAVELAIMDRCDSAIATIRQLLAGEEEKS